LLNSVIPYCLFVLDIVKIIDRNFCAIAWRDSSNGKLMNPCLSNSFLSVKQIFYENNHDEEEDMQLKPSEVLSHWLFSDTFLLTQNLWLLPSVPICSKLLIL
jgi:hypothetical protein